MPRPCRSTFGRLVAALACLAPFAGGALPAQEVAPPAAMPASARVLRAADSLAIEGDSAAALALLRAQLGRDRRDAGAWYRQGMILWAQARTDRRAGLIRSQEQIGRLRLADSSLRMATSLAPDSARFAVGLGRFYLNSGLASTRFAAQSYLKKALDAGRRVPDPRALADAADEVGMVHWRRYETYARRRTMAVGMSASDMAQYAHRDARDLEQLVEQHTSPITQPSGDLDYHAATDLFAEALAADPNHRGALRHRFMSLADKGLWSELRAAADQRLRQTPWDAQAWLARGLASHRLNDPRAATAAFDSALVLLAPEDVERYTRLSRILRATPLDKQSAVVSDSARYLALGEEQRGAVDKLYWMLADPLTLTPENEHRLEFLSRVAFAELRWTSEDFGLPGADTDRGDIHVRYGPPPAQLALGGDNTSANTELWLYGNGLHFVFDAPPTWGTARLSGDYFEVARRARDAEPVRWTNVPVNRTIDSIPVLAARFRAGDSTDVFLAADVPLTRLVRGVDVVRATVDVDLKIFDAAAGLMRHDSTRVAVRTETPPVQLRAWRSRVGAGTNVYRVEALRPDALEAARAMGTVLTRSATGFGVSDVLLAERVAPRGDAAPARWSDFAIQPSAGRFRRGQTIDLLWETYDLAAADGGSRYRVAITLEKVERRGASQLAARVVGGVAEMMGRTVTGNHGTVTLRYDRATPARPAVVDYVTLDLTTAAPGQYRVAVGVTDMISKRTTSQRTTLTVLP
jgi:GWxTD domain-containing protein